MHIKESAFRQPQLPIIILRYTFIPLISLAVELLKTYIT